MKLHITQEQIDEISPEQQLIYIKTLHLDVYGTRLDLPDIGHLVWFLDEHVRGWWRVERSAAHDAWRVNEEYGYPDDKGNPELIDALWEYVKVILSMKENT